MTPITYRTVEVDDVKIFYREAGPPDAPARLLLHCFPSDSDMFRDPASGLSLSTRGARLARIWSVGHAVPQASANFKNASVNFDKHEG